MNYIVLDLEFNQDFSSLQTINRELLKYPFEIIQIGAIKLDSHLNTVDTFNRYVKPTIYSKISPFITELTGITTQQLQIESTFPEIYSKFLDFIGDPDSVFCIWGMSDIKEIYKNVDFHKLNLKQLPDHYINIQPYVSIYLDLPQQSLVRLSSAVKALNIPTTYDFHNALNDAYYTAEVFKKTYNPYITPKTYDPSYVRFQPRVLKKEIDFDKLLQQFEKMYARTLTKEEEGMILLAYKMGKTLQFLK